MSMFRELKAKKHAFGFTTPVSSWNIVALGLFLATALRGAKEHKDFFLESSQSGGGHDLKLYTDDPALAAHIRKLDGFDIPDNTQAFLDGGNLFDKALHARYAIGDETDEPDGPNA